MIRRQRSPALTLNLALNLLPNPNLHLTLTLLSARPSKTDLTLVPHILKKSCRAARAVLDIPSGYPVAFPRSAMRPLVLVRAWLLLVDASQGQPARQQDPAETPRLMIDANGHSAR